MKRKLQVFISSTYTDMLEERQAAVEAVLAAGHIPAGMELFAAGDDTQFELIKRWIDESDIYMLILGGRYGSIEPKSKKSYIQVEYEYAMKKGKHFFALVINEKALDGKINKFGKSVIELENQKQYKDFRNLVLGRVCRIYDDAKDIKLAVMASLNDCMDRYNLSGWISAKEAMNIGDLPENIVGVIEEQSDVINLLEKKIKSQNSVVRDIYDLAKAFQYDIIMNDKLDFYDKLKTLVSRYYIYHEEKTIVECYSIEEITNNYRLSKNDISLINSNETIVKKHWKGFVDCLIIPYRSYFLDEPAVIVIEPEQGIFNQDVYLINTLLSYFEASIMMNYYIYEANKKKNIDD